VDIHILADGNQTLKQAHDLTEEIEHTTQQFLPNVDVTIHPEPNMKYTIAHKMMQKASLYIFCFLLVFSLGGTSASSRDLVIISANVGECTLAVEANDQWHTLRLRAHHPQGRGCHIDRDSMLSALSAALLKAELPRLEGSYSSLFVGRLIDYPWLSQYLATTASHDKGWDVKKGKPIAMDINRYVAQLLSRRELLAQLETVFAQGGYRIIGVSVEKVLVGGLREVPLYQGAMAPGLVPYDAMVWFRLEKS